MPREPRAVGPGRRARPGRRRRPGGAWGQALHGRVRRGSGRGRAGAKGTEWAAEGGRGEAHLSFALEAGDVVAYQVGTWEVDGAEVGPGGAPEVELLSVDHLQIVWTHNCEHGEVRGWPLALAQDRSGQGWTALRAGEELVQCGPEQLVARLPARWDAGGGPGDSGELLEPLPGRLADAMLLASAAE